MSQKASSPLEYALRSGLTLLPSISDVRANRELLCAEPHTGIQAKGNGMTDLADLEQRLAAALDRVSAAIAARSADVPSGVDNNGLQMALDEERMLSAQLSERLRAVKEKEIQSQTQINAKLDQMSSLLDAQGAELNRMRRSNLQLREVLRILREASVQGLSDPDVINSAMLAELDALRATRLTEVAEMDEILAELAPLIEEVREDA